MWKIVKFPRKRVNRPQPSDKIKDFERFVHDLYKLVERNI